MDSDEKTGDICGPGSQGFAWGRVQSSPRKDRAPPEWYDPEANEWSPFCCYCGCDNFCTPPGHTVQRQGYGVTAAHTKLDCVQIEGLVVLKVIKHCRDEGNPIHPAVSGQLLGMDITLSGVTTLEVTSCFPMPLQFDAVDAEAETHQYVTDMLRCMRDVNVDSNIVGWYQSSCLGSWLDPEGPSVATQFHFQESVPMSVCLVYDPIRTTSGSVCLKAYRLTDNFMAKYRGHLESNASGFTEHEFKTTYDCSGKAVDEGITMDEVFEEVPIRIHNSALVNAKLYDWVCEGTMRAKMDLERLDLGSRAVLDRSMAVLVEGLDVLLQDEGRLEFRKRDVQRRRREHRRNAREEVSQEDLVRAYPDPSRLQGLLTANQVKSHCDGVGQMAGQGLSMLYLIQGMRAAHPPS